MAFVLGDVAVDSLDPAPLAGKLEVVIGDSLLGLAGVRRFFWGWDLCDADIFGLAPLCCNGLLANLYTYGPRGAHN